MLYVSRRLGVSQYGVVDTDDDIEEEHTSDELVNIVVEYGLTIHGVNNIGKCVLDIRPFQDPRYCTAKAARLKVIHGVDLCVWRDTLVFVEVNAAVKSEYPPIRFSDYALKYSGLCLVDVVNDSANDTRGLTFILDDKLEFLDYPPYTLQPGVLWDIRELTNEEIVKEMYQTLLNSVIDFKFWPEHIIDTQSRMKKFASLS